MKAHILVIATPGLGRVTAVHAAVAVHVAAVLVEGLGRERPLQRGDEEDRSEEAFRGEVVVYRSCYHLAMGAVDTE